MQQVLPDLWETAVESPFPGLTTHAYLLLREDGNVLFYNTSHQNEIERMAKLGGVAYQYLSHQDELGDGLKVLHERFGTRLGGHVAEREAFARFREPEILFERRETHLGNIEVIPTPGHSPGSTCFLVDSPRGGRYLFTGDTLFRDEHGEWTAGFIPGHSTEEDRQAMARSIPLLRELEPDVVLSSAFGDAGYQVMSPGEWPDHVDRAVEKLLA
jgi:hydroxyacylglutathione hydrolase